MRCMCAGILLLGAHLVGGCGNESDSTPSKDDSRSEQSDDDDSSKKKKTKKKAKKSAEKDDGKKATPSDDAVFTARPPQVGDEAHQTSKETVTMEVEARGRKVTIDEVTNKEKIEKTVAVSNGRATKLEISYVQRSKLKSEGGKETSKVEPVQGKAYIVENDGAGGPKVTSANGASLTPDEVKLVEKDYRRTFKSPSASEEMKKALLGAKLVEGERVTEVEKAFASYFAEDDVQEPGKTITISEVKLVYRGIKGDNALFDISFSMKVEEKNMVIVMPLEGQLEVRRVGAVPVTMSLKAPLEVDASKMPVPVTLTGEVKMNTTEVFTPAN